MTTNTLDMTEEQWVNWNGSGDHPKNGKVIVVLRDGTQFTANAHSLFWRRTQDEIHPNIEIVRYMTI